MARIGDLVRPRSFNVSSGRSQRVENPALLAVSRLFGSLGEFLTEQDARERQEEEDVAERERVEQEAVAERRREFIGGFGGELEGAETLEGLDALSLAAQQAGAQEQIAAPLAARREGLAKSFSDQEAKDIIARAQALTSATGLGTGAPTRREIRTSAETAGATPEELSGLQQRGRAKRKGERRRGAAETKAEVQKAIDIEAGKQALKPDDPVVPSSLVDNLIPEARAKALTNPRFIPAAEDWITEDGKEEAAVVARSALIDKVMDRFASVLNQFLGGDEEQQGNIRQSFMGTGDPQALAQLGDEQLTVARQRAAQEATERIEEYALTFGFEAAALVYLRLPSGIRAFLVELQELKARNPEVEESTVEGS